MRRHFRPSTSGLRPKLVVMESAERTDIVPRGTIRRDRLATILRRLEQGFYDRAVVQHHIATSAASDLR